MQFSRLLKKYQELPVLGSEVTRFKLLTFKKPELTRNNQSKSIIKDSNTAAIEVLSSQMNVLIQIIIHQNNTSNVTFDT